MKTLKFATTVLCVSIFSLGLTSCSNDDETITNPDNLTETEAVEIVSSSLQKSTGGVTETSKSYSEELTVDITLNELCDTLYEENFSFTSDNDIISANYDVNWAYQLSCNNFNIPQSAVFNSNSTGAYRTTRVSSSDANEASFSVTGLQPSADNYVFTGDFRRNGSQDITTNNFTKSVTSVVVIQITELTIDKVDYSIISGTGVASLTGQTGQGNSFAFEGSVTFNNDNTATLVIGGNMYTIDLN